MLSVLGQQNCKARGRWGPGGAQSGGTSPAAHRRAYSVGRGPSPTRIPASQTMGQSEGGSGKGHPLNHAHGDKGKWRKERTAHFPAEFPAGGPESRTSHPMQPSQVWHGSHPRLPCSYVDAFPGPGSCGPGSPPPTQLGSPLGASRHMLVLRILRQRGGGHNGGTQGCTGWRE